MKKAYGRSLAMSLLVGALLLIPLYLVAGDGPEGDLAGPAPWPMLGCDRSHTGRSPYLGAQKADLKWQRSYNGDGGNSSPVIGSDGTVYTGLADFYLYAINPEDGSWNWRFYAEGYIQGSPAVGSDGTIYFGSNSLNLFALNPDGSEKWRYHVGEYSVSPVIGADGTIYCGGSRLFAFNPDGTIKWTYAPIETWEEGFSGSPAIGPDGTIYCHNGYYLYALDSDGSFKWRRSTGMSQMSTPAVASDGTIYFGLYDSYGYGFVYAVDPTNTVKWSAYFYGAYGFSRPAIGSEGTVYIGSNRLYALDPENGAVKWSSDTDSGYSSPSMGSDGTLYVGSGDGNLYALNPADGTEKWQFATPYTSLSGPVIGADGTIYAGGYNPGSHEGGALYALGAVSSPGISVSPESAGFYSWPVGGLSYPVSITISNTGTTDLTISEITLTDDVNFTLSSLGGCSEAPTLSPGSSCTFAVVFKPLKSGSFSEAIYIGSSDPVTPRVIVPMAGSGITEPLTVTLNLPGASSTNPPHKAYRMIGLPAIPGDQDVFGFLKSKSAGSYRSNVWRSYFYVNGEVNGIDGEIKEITELIELINTRGANVNILGGERGFWLISQRAKKIQVLGYPALKDFSTFVTAGYHIIPCPFMDRSVEWANVLTDPDNADTVNGRLLGSSLWYYDGSGNFVNASIMEPGRSYFVWAEREGTLHIKRSYSTGAFPEPASVRSANALSQQPPPPPAPGASIKVQAPKRGARVKRGAEYTIRWSSLGISPEGYDAGVDISLSTDGGKSYVPIASKVENTGSYVWKVTQTKAERKCRIKITSCLYPDVSVEINRNFVIK